MKTKLNLTIDVEVIAQYKRFAKKHHQSVSALIEQQMRAVTDNRQKKFSDRWQGQLNLANKSSDRYKLLSEKY